MIPPPKSSAAPVRRWPVPALCLLLSAASAAQEPADFETRETLPPEAVLVVRLISATEVVPTTGIVVGATGEVLVPDAFVSDEGETVVLDGGGDLSRHGRPATLVRRLPQSGLALLRAPNLERPAAVLAADPGADGSELRLGAFPPAELLAGGAGPMWLAATLSANPVAGIYGLAEATPIPNVSGPLFNHCGQWAGYSVAIGEPAMKSGFRPIVLFSPELARVLRELGTVVDTAPCARAEATPADEAQTGSRPGEPPPPASPDSPGSHTSVDEAPGVAEPAPDASTGDESPPPAPAETLPAWVPVTVALGAGAVVAALLLAVRRRRADGEPATRVLVEGPRSGAAPAEPDWSALPPGCDRWLVLEAQETEQEPARRWGCAVGGDRFSVRVGRRDADLVVPHASVSRAHARLDGRCGVVTVTDLGSANGTCVGRAPCLPGERFRLQPGDTLVLGSRRLRFRCVGAGFDGSDGS